MLRPRKSCVVVLGWYKANHNAPTERSAMHRPWKRTTFWKRTTLQALSFALVLGATPLTSAKAIEAQSNVSWQRIAGSNRYETMAAIANRGFTNSNFAVLVSGENFPDALIASSIAGALDCPILLTQSSKLSDQALGQILRLGTDVVYVVGGPSAISDRTTTSLQEQGISVVRVAGENRQGTSVEALKLLESFGTSFDTVIVANGTHFADALSIGPWSYSTSSPIVLANQSGLLSDKEVATIQNNPQIRNIVIVGGKTAVSDKIMDQLGSSYAFTRLAGDSRYETNREVATWSVLNGLSWSYPFVASGSNFPDALAGSALSGHIYSVMLLYDRNSSVTPNLLAQYQDSISAGYLLGGEKALPTNDPIDEATGNRV